MELPSRFIEDGCLVTENEYNKAYSTKDYNFLVSIVLGVNDMSNLAIYCKSYYDEDISSISLIINLDSHDLSLISEGSCTLTIYDGMDTLFIDMCVDFMEDYMPNIKYLKFIENDAILNNSVYRSIALNGQFYIENVFAVKPEGIDYDIYNNAALKYVSEEYKNNTPWSMYLDRYPILTKYIDECEPLYNESRRFVDFTRKCEDLLPNDVMSELVYHIVNKEFGYIPLVWVYDFKHVFARYDDSESEFKCKYCTNDTSDTSSNESQPPSPSPTQT